MEPFLTGSDYVAGRRARHIGPASVNRGDWYRIFKFFGRRSRRRRPLFYAGNPRPDRACRSFEFCPVPLVRALQRLSLPRSLAVLGAVSVAMAIALSLATMVMIEVNQLANDLPRYQSTLGEKIHKLRDQGWQRWRAQERLQPVEESRPGAEIAGKQRRPDSQALVDGGASKSADSGRSPSARSGRVRSTGRNVATARHSLYHDRNRRDLPHLLPVPEGRSARSIHPIARERGSGAHHSGAR